MATVTALLSTPGRRPRHALARRVQATALTAVLVLGSATPSGIAVAREADQGSEGTAAPEQAPPDSTADPDFDPGGDTGLPFDVGGHDS
ncbi:MAG TPA: hypothetical protein VFK56_19440, partial [Mycobacterium sp.]|nr:hypothetical protein [Mycobacterium sp.]